MPSIQPSNNALPVGFSHDFLETVRNLIAYFVLRQQIVVLAMVTHNPRALRGSVDIEVRPYIEAHYKRHLELKEAIKERDSDVERPLPIWNNHWKCFPHGHGCRLTHLDTGERIEWDAPDRDAFRIDWFLNHLKWRLKYQLDDPYVSRCNDWMEANAADIEVVGKAINCLIELRVVVIHRDHTCKLRDEATTLSNTSHLTEEVIDAFLRRLTHYRQRQQIAIEAMVELRPDFIGQVARDPYTMPDTAQRLAHLYKHLESLPEPGSKIQTGTWRDEWEYDIRYATCTLTHSETKEQIRWSTSDPLVVDYHGYTQHLMWQFNSNQDNVDLQVINHWLHEYGEGTFDVFTILLRLISLLTSSEIVALSRNEKGLLMKWKDR